MEADIDRTSLGMLVPNGYLVKFNPQKREENQDLHAKSSNFNLYNHQKHCQKSTKSTLFTQKRGQRHGFRHLSIQKNKKKKLVLGLSNHHLIDVGAGCTTSLPETLLRRGNSRG
jgi:hypothetical protein